MQISGFVVLLATIVASRLINERAFRKLDSEAKLRLMDGFSRTRSYSMIPLLVLIVAYWYLMTQTKANPQILTVAYFGLIGVYVVARIVLNQAKLSQLDMPEDYRRLFSISQAVSFVGIAWFFFSVFQGM